MEVKEQVLLKGGEFMIKASAPDEIFTPEDFSEEQIMMRDSVKELIESISLG